MTDQPRPAAVTPPAVAAPVQPRLYYGWYVVFAAATVTFVEMAGFNTTFSVFVKPMTEEFGWTRTQFSIGVSIGSLLAGILVLGLGRLIDLRGPKYVILGGVATLVVCLTLLSQVSALWQLWALFAVSRALSSATLDLSSTVLVANWFIQQRGRAMGLASLGRRAAIALLPLIGQAIIVAFGWRAGWVGVAGIVAVVGILPTALLVRRRPEDMGLRPDGAAPANPAPAESASGQPRVLRQDVSWTLQEALRTPAFWLLMGVGCASFFVGGSVNLHQVAYMIDMGLSPTVAVTSLSSLRPSGRGGDPVLGVAGGPPAGPVLLRHGPGVGRHRRVLSARRDVGVHGVPVRGGLWHRIRRHHTPDGDRVGGLLRAEESGFSPERGDDGPDGVQRNRAALRCVCV